MERLNEWGIDEDALAVSCREDRFNREFNKMPPEKQEEIYRELLALMDSVRDKDIPLPQPRYQ